MIQIQHLLKLNAAKAGATAEEMENSNTTLVKVKWYYILLNNNINLYSNTTLVKVKWIGGKLIQK